MAQSPPRGLHGTITTMEETSCAPSSSSTQNQDTTPYLWSMLNSRMRMSPEEAALKLVSVCTTGLRGGTTSQYHTSVEEDPPVDQEGTFHLGTTTTEMIPEIKRLKTHQGFIPQIIPFYMTTWPYMNLHLLFVMENLEKILQVHNLNRQRQIREGKIVIAKESPVLGQTETFWETDDRCHWSDNQDESRLTKRSWDTLKQIYPRTYPWKSHKESLMTEQLRYIHRSTNPANHPTPDNLNWKLGRIFPVVDNCRPRSIQRKRPYPPFVPKETEDAVEPIVMAQFWTGLVHRMEDSELEFQMLVPSQDSSRSMHVIWYTTWWHKNFHAPPRWIAGEVWGTELLALLTRYYPQMAYEFYLTPAADHYMNHQSTPPHWKEHYEIFWTTGLVKCAQTTLIHTSLWDYFCAPHERQQLHTCPVTRVSGGEILR